MCSARDYPNLLTTPIYKRRIERGGYSRLRSPKVSVLNLA